MIKDAQFLAYFFVTINLTCANIVFDLGDVLVYSDKVRISYQIGWQQFIGYALFDFKNPVAIQKKVFDLLDTLGKQTSSNNLYAMNDGIPLPQIMCDWLMGTKSSQQILDEVKQKANELDAQHYFASTRERKLILRIIKSMFDPYTFAHSTCIKNRGLELVEKLAKNKKHKLFILSNWDPESFALIKKLPGLQKLFKLFSPENIVISGDIHMIKPHDDIYAYLLEHYNLNPQETIFIDDMAENIAAAERVGINGIQLVNNDYSEVKEELALLLAEIEKTQTSIKTKKPYLEQIQDFFKYLYTLLVSGFAAIYNAFKTVNL